MRRRVAVCAILLAACGGSDDLTTGELDLTGSWATRAPLPAPRQEMPSAEISGRIYTPGGLDAQGAASSALTIYDVLGNGWGAGPPMPQPRHHPGVASRGGRLYVIGGYGAGAFPGTLSDDVFIYNPGPNPSWTTGAPMPAPRAAHVSVEFQGKIYSIGGVRGGAVVGTNEAYDPSTDTWSTLAPMPTPREHLAAAVVDLRILVVGGRAPGNLPTVEAYTPATNTWEELPSMPTARGGLAAAAIGRTLYVFGGEVPGVFPHVEAFDGSTWRRMRDMPTPRHGMGAVSVGAQIYVIGGATVAGFGASAANEAFVPF